MNEIKPCPFCGSSNVNFDTIKGKSGKIYAVQMKCRNCGAGTEWSDSHQSVAAWNMRDAQTAVQTSPFKDRIITDDLFTLDEATYARNPHTGNCYVHPWRNGEKARRISRKIFTERYQTCGAKTAGKNKARGGKHGASS